jgi:hypothetical protein
MLSCSYRESTPLWNFDANEDLLQFRNMGLLREWYRTTADSLSSGVRSFDPPSFQRQGTAESNVLASGKEQGESIAAYLIARMKEGKLTPADAVNVAAAQIEKQTEKMLAAGTSRTDVVVWLKGLREAVSDRISAFTESEQ